MLSASEIVAHPQSNPTHEHFLYSPTNKEVLSWNNKTNGQHQHLPMIFYPSSCKDSFSAPESKMKKNSQNWETLSSTEEALTSLESGLLVDPSEEYILQILQKCTKEQKQDHVLRLLAYVRERGLEGYPSLGNQLFLMLVEAGSLYEAEEVLDKLLIRDETSITLLIKALIRHGQPQQALCLYEKVKDDDSIHLRPHTYSVLLKVCADFKLLEHGHKLHTDVASKGLLKTEINVGNSLVSMYTKTNALAKAQEVFEELPVRDVVSWNAMIAGYAKQGRGLEALTFFDRMHRDGVTSNPVTYICGLKACCSIGATRKGQEIHAEVARKGLLQTDLRVGCTLLDMYAKCGLLASAQEVFDDLPIRNHVAWNTLISGYAEHGLGMEALTCYERMRADGVSPDATTFSSCLKACSSIKATDKGLELHSEISNSGLLEDNHVLASALVDMYAKCGMLGKAQEIFDKLPVRDVVSWTGMIAGYAEHGPGEKALTLFEQMQLDGVPPNAVTFLCGLKACGSLGATYKGREMHALIAKKGHLERDLLVGSTLVDMYAKCGLLLKAQEAFNRLPYQDVVAWNALMAGYSQLGRSTSTFFCFCKMIGAGVKPNSVTFISLLNTCNHMGLVDKGQYYFETMSKEYGIVPTIEHLTCMVDLWGRSGQLENMAATIRKLPITPDKVMWLMTLSACQKWKSVNFGRWAFECAVQADMQDPTIYVCMRNIYADAGMQEHAKRIEAIRLKNQACEKTERCRWMDGTGVVHTFTAGDMHQLSSEARAKVEALSGTIGRDKASLLSGHGSASASGSPCGHTQLFAIAFALVNTCEGTPVHVTKNFRVCNDCHVALARLSDIEGRILIVRDTCCRHVFEQGQCACGAG